MTKQEVYDNLDPELQIAYASTKECFGVEYATDDESCKGCADDVNCKGMFEATGDVIIPQTSTETPQDTPSEEKPTGVPEEQENPPMSEDLKTVPEKEAPPPEEEKKVAVPPEEDSKEKPKGFGDRSAAKDDFGFTIGTKGSYIANLFKEGLETKKSLNDKATTESGTDSAGRVNMVLYKLRTNSYPLKRLGKEYYIDGVTPADKVAIAQRASDDVEEAAAKVKVEKAEKKKALVAEAAAKKADADAKKADADAKKVEAAAKKVEKPEPAEPAGKKE